MTRVPVRVVALAVVGAFVCGACANGRTPADEPVLVLAAASLTGVLGDLTAAYEAETGTRIDVVLGSSGNLAAQIRYGAPADLFFSADEAFLDALIASGHVRADSRSVYAVGRLALVVPPGRVPPAGVQALADPAFRVVAIANPDHAPYGRAAREALRAAGVWEAVEPRLVLGENVAQALQFVRTGNADAGLIALGLVVPPAEGVSAGHVVAGRSEVPYRDVDAGLHAPILQLAGVTTASVRPGSAQAFLRFVLSEAGREILYRHGFDAPTSFAPTR